MYEWTTDTFIWIIIIIIFMIVNSAGTGSAMELSGGTIHEVNCLNSRSIILSIHGSVNR
jgi:hypothetical protein